MKTDTRTSRAIALITVMIMVGILGMMSAAFFQIYRSHFSLTRSSLSTQAASAGCEAIYEYVMYRLEHERAWGAVPFPDSGESKLTDLDITISTEPNTHRFRGRLESIDTDFTALIYNNLNGGGSPEVASRAPAGKVYCVVSATCRESSRRAEFVLDIAPLFDSSVLTRADLRVDADTVEIRSTDPDRNMVRAEGDIVMPGLLGGQTRFLTEDGAPDERGLLWAKQKIYSGEPGSSEMVDTVDELAAARKNSHGKIVPDGESHFSIMDINESHLQLPDGTNVVSLAGDPIANKGGRWTFVRREAEVDYKADYSKPAFPIGKEVKPRGGVRTMWVDVLEYYDDPNSDTPTAIYRGAQRTEDIEEAIPSEIDGFFGDYKLETDSITVGELRVLKYVGQDIPTEIVSGDAKTYGEHGEIRFDLTNQRVTIDSEATVEVDGPFYVTSETDPESGAPDTPPPVLDLGYKANGSAPGGVTKATLIAKDTISIENGVTEGLGRLVSKTGDVRVQPKDTKSVTVDTTQDGTGLLVYAGRDVILNNPDSTKNWNFRGLVYARRNILMNGGGVAKATFEGTIVSFEEKSPTGSDSNGIEFRECGDIEFIYNPDLLSNYVKELPDQKIQVQSVYWKR